MYALYYNGIIISYMVTTLQGGRAHRIWIYSFFFLKRSFLKFCVHWGEDPVDSFPPSFPAHNHIPRTCGYRAGWSPYNHARSSAAPSVMNFHYLYNWNNKNACRQDNGGQRTCGREGDWRHGCRPYFRRLACGQRRRRQRGWRYIRWRAKGFRGVRSAYHHCYYDDYYHHHRYRYHWVYDVISTSCTLLKLSNLNDIVNSWVLF